LKHAVIVGHPDPVSFTQSMAKRYEACMSAHGHEVLTRDLYPLGFDPRLGLGDRRFPDDASEAVAPSSSYTTGRDTTSTVDKSPLSSSECRAGT
jgi:putative NADPH-quinone reductase